MAEKKERDKFDLTADLYSVLPDNAMPFAILFVEKDTGQYRVAAFDLPNIPKVLQTLSAMHPVRRESETRQ